MDSLRSYTHPSKSLMELGKVSHPVQSHSVCGGCLLDISCLYIQSRGTCRQEWRGAKWGGGRRLSHVFSFQSISPLDPGGLPPAQAARSDSSLSQGKLPLQNRTKALNSWLLSWRAFSFALPPLRWGRGKAWGVDTGCPPHLCWGCRKGAEPIWEQRPSDGGTSHQHASAAGDRSRGRCIQARRVCLHLRENGEQVLKFPVSQRSLWWETRRVQSGDSLCEGMWNPLGVAGTNPQVNQRGWPMTPWVPAQGGPSPSDYCCFLLMGITALCKQTSQDGVRNPELNWVPPSKPKDDQVYPSHGLCFGHQDAWMRD